MEEVIAGKFEVRGVLGEGGSGVVYDAVRRTDGAPVALKVMHADLAGDAQVRGRFIREAAILARLEGPSICPILEHGRIEGADGKGEVLYLALPKLDGPTLEEVLIRDGLLPLPRALGIIRDVLAALAVAHAHGVIHRDLKPANVVLEGGTRVVVVDFGLAKIITGSGTGTTNLTMHNMLFGTPEYMAPEQARGDELDPRCDVYAAGVILYRLLTGEVPFTAPTPLAVLTAHLTSPLEPPSKRAGTGRVSPELERVVLTALARDPGDRYPTAEAFAEALRDVSPPETRASRADPLAATLPASPSVEEAPLAARPAAVGADARPEADARHTTQPSAGYEPGKEPLLTPRSPRKKRTVTRDNRAPSSGRPGSSKAPDRLAGPGSAPAGDPSVRTWVLLWVLVGVASIGVGVALALR